MAKRVEVSTLNASTIDIMNVIRQNASYDYQQNVPKVTKANDIPKVGDVIYGTPAFANQFINALVNRIALVRVKSATFNNPYSMLKKGYLEYGETVEEIFTNIAKVVEYDTSKAPQREYQRTIPDVKSAFHTMNWRVMYPVTIQDEDLRMAFLSIEGVQNLIASIVDSVYTGAEYDEFLLFKYMLIKAISGGKMYPVSIGDGSNFNDSAVKFRGISNILPFIKSEYNSARVKNNTPKERQVIFMDSMYNAQFDVNVLASAFNMDKADFMGRLFLIDDWTTFDNERFEVIRANSTGIEEVTPQELALLKNVKAVMLDSEWFQVYDNNSKFTEQYSASGMYWNYFYHTWKTVSSSPFANAVVFVQGAITPPATINVTVSSKSSDAEAITLGLQTGTDALSLADKNVTFVQTEEMTTNGIAMQEYGALLIPNTKKSQEVNITCKIGDVTYTNSLAGKLSADSNVGTKIVLNKEE